MQAHRQAVGIGAADAATPFDKAGCLADVGGIALQVTLGLHAPHHFVSLYGSPFFGTLSIREDRESFKGIGTAYLRADYHHTFARNYVLGAGIEAGQSWLGKSATHNCSQEFNFSFGIYLRACPSFLLKQF